MNWPAAIFGSVVSVLLVFLWREVKPLIERKIQTQEKLAQAELSKREAETQVAQLDVAERTKEPTPRDALPLTVRRIANDWRDEWAREAAMDAYCELYDQTQNWDAVISAAMSDQAQYMKERGQLA